MEDVQYALQQGTAAEQSFLFVIDSAMRDKNAYPTPSEYYIPFPQAFRNVFAVDLVDAMVARTEYSVDTHNNAVCYAAGTWTSYDHARLAGEIVTVRIQPGDYNTPQLIIALNDALNTAGLARNHIPLRVEPVSDPVDVTNKLRFSRSEPFCVFMHHTTMRYVLGFGNPAYTPGAPVGWDSTVLYATDESVSNDIFQSVTVTQDNPTLAFAGPVPIDLVEYSVTTPVRQTFTAATSGLLTNVLIRGVTSSTVPMTGRVYDANDTLIETATGTASAATSQWLISFAKTHELLAGSVYKLVIEAEGAAVYKAETFSDDAANQLASGTGWSTISTTEAVCCDVTVAIAGHKVESPGQCNLTGERYVLIRSPDIEQYLHRDLAAAFDRMAPGLGMMKLGGLGYREERFNFLAYTTRRFHPIGKLKGIRIRLETQSGRVYDAHGIDHTLLLCIKMYAPGPSTRIPRDLFPGYTPDPRLALVRKLERERFTQ